VSLFRGVNQINLDAKGRFAMPTRYRERLLDRSEGQLVVTIDPEERCLLIYPLTDWEEIEQKIEALPSFNKAAKRVKRLLIGHATDLELDGSGRVLLPPQLREHAELDKKVVLIGQGKKFELWSEDHWNRSRELWLENEGDDENMPDELLSLSL